MARYLEHICDHGERWDLIAYDYYGDAMLMHHLLKANPQITSRSPAPLVFAKGTKLRVPILSEAEIAAPQLPVWKRS